MKASTSSSCSHHSPLWSRSLSSALQPFQAGLSLRVLAQLAMRQGQKRQLCRDQADDELSIRLRRLGECGYSLFILSVADPRCRAWSGTHRCRVRVCGPFAPGDCLVVPSSGLIWPSHDRPARGVKLGTVPITLCKEQGALPHLITNRRTGASIRVLAAGRVAGRIGTAPGGVLRVRLAPPRSRGAHPKS